MKLTQAKLGIPTLKKDEVNASDIMQFKFQPLNLISQWNRCSITANFYSKIQESKIKEKRKQVTHIVSSIINELLESALKYSVEKTDTVAINTFITGNKAHFEIETICDKCDTILYRRFYKTHYQEKDSEATILKLLETYSDNDNISLAIGLLGLKKDYNAQLGINIKLVNKDK